MKNFTSTYQLPTLASLTGGLLVAVVAVAVIALIIVAGFLGA